MNHLLARPWFALVCTISLLCGVERAHGQTIPFSVSLYYPSNSQSFSAPTNIYVHARVTDSNIVQTIQYFAGTMSIGTVTNTGNLLFTNTSQSNPFYLTWSNVTAGTYGLTALARDNAGNSATSAVVTISVTNPVLHPATYIYSPTNNTTLSAPTNITVYARAVETYGTIATVQFFANTLNLGIVSNASQMVYTNISSEPLFAQSWSNVTIGTYALRAVATDLNGNSTTSSVITLNVVTNSVSTVRPSVAIYSPTNGAKFTAPTNLNLYARAVETSGQVSTVQFFANSLSLGIVSNSSQVIVSNISSQYVFPLMWSNAPVGSYSLTAVATDTNGYKSTSSIVSISIITNSPPPHIPFVVAFWYPTNGQAFLAPAAIGVHALVTDSNVVQTMQYFANETNLGTVTNTALVLLTNSTQGNPFFLSWSNVPAGIYALTALATDTTGATATSAPVTISVTNTPPPPNIPYHVGFFYPTNNQLFLASSTIGLHASVTDSNVVRTIQYFANGNFIALVTNSSGLLLTSPTQSNPFFYGWSNAVPGNYAVTAVATDAAGLVATSGPVNIYVVSNLPPVLTLYAPDPVAVFGTNYNPAPVPAQTGSSYATGTNTATFLVHRDIGTNLDLTAYYSISGTASNGIDYQPISTSVVIPAGKTYALITIVPLYNTNSLYGHYKSVVLTLISPPSSTNFPPAYTLTSPSQAGAVILDENLIPMPQPVVHALADNSIHVSLPATNGMNFCLQTSSDLINWTSVCTNTVLKGSAQFVDPSHSTPGLYYRIVPVASPASY